MPKRYCKAKLASSINFGDKPTDERLVELSEFAQGRNERMNALVKSVHSSEAFLIANSHRLLKSALSGNVLEVLQNAPKGEPLELTRSRETPRDVMGEETGSPEDAAEAFARKKLEGK